jgi:glutamate synthase domain-containing protein 3
MSNIANLSDATANAEANALAPLLNAGFIELYTGAQPANANTALSGNTLLATMTFGNPAFGAAAAGVITANTIASGTAVATGTATFARLYKSDGTTVVMDVTVGTSGAAINLNTTSIVTGGLVSITSFTHTVTET